MKNSVFSKFRRWSLIVFTELVYKRAFSYIGKKSYIEKPVRIDSPDRISLGSNVHIASYGWLMGGDEEKKGASLCIGDNTTVGHFAHIIALNKVVIENDVLIADRVFITDTMHKYEDVSVPIKNQGLTSCGEVVIGKGSWIGENVCIMGAKIGEHSIVGANAVVTKDVPSYSIIGGVPAKMIKKYDFDLKKWISVEDHSEI